MDLPVYQATDWQDKAFRICKDADHSLTDVPGGAGKSLQQCALAAYDMLKDERRKQVICVPQSHISYGFGAKRISIGGLVLDWKLDYNLCTQAPGRVSRLRDFLLGNWGGTAVCTHAGLARLWSTLTTSEKSRAVRRLTLTLDEAHHLAGVLSAEDLSQYPEAERDELLQVWPKLSECVRMMIGRPGCKVRLATATFYRGDQAVILSDEVRSRFVQYRLRWEDYFPQTGIQSIDFAFDLYDRDPLAEVVRRVRKERRRRHLIILPKTGQRFCDPLTAKRLVGDLERVLGPDLVLDLVTIKPQKDNKRLLFAHPEQYHAVVACCLFNEGTDWPACDVMHNTDASERSVTLAMQRFYRPLRRHPGKTRVGVLHEKAKGQTRAASLSVLYSQLAGPKRRPRTIWAAARFSPPGTARTTTARGASMPGYERHSLRPVIMAHRLGTGSACERRGDCAQEPVGTR